MNTALEYKFRWFNRTFKLSICHSDSGVLSHLKQDHVDLWKLKGPRLGDKKSHARRRRYLLLHGNLLKAVSNHGKSAVLMKGNYEHAKLLNAV